MSRPRTPIGTFGSIRTEKDASGRFHAYTRFRDQDGKLRPIKASGLTRQAAIRELKAKLASRTGAPGESELTIASPLPALAARWIEHVNAAGTLEQSTKELYVWNMEHYVLPLLKDFALGELTVARRERFLQSQAAVSRNRALQSRKTFSLALAMAARFGAIPPNPIRECSKLKRSAGRPDALSVEEVRTIREFVRAWRAGQGHPGPPPDGQLAAGATAQPDQPPARTRRPRNSASELSARAFVRFATQLRGLPESEMPAIVRIVRIAVIHATGGEPSSDQ